VDYLVCGATDSVTRTQGDVLPTYPKDALHKSAYRGNVEEVANILKTKPDYAPSAHNQQSWHFTVV